MPEPSNPAPQDGASKKSSRQHRNRRRKNPKSGAKQPPGAQKHAFSGKPKTAGRGQPGRAPSTGGRIEGPEKEILRILKAGPADKAQLANKLNLTGAERKNFQELLRSLETKGTIARIRGDRYIIPQEADLFTGEIQVHPSGAAHVLAKPGEGSDIFVSAENTITAMHGDTVVVRIFPSRGPQNQAAEERRREGRVIRVLHRANDRIVGTLQKTRNFFFVVADDPRFVHNLYVPEPALPAKPGDKVVARLDSWESRHVNPEGTVIEVLGAAGAPGVDMLGIVRKHRLPEAFPREVVEAAERSASVDPSTEAKNREDRRNDFVFTIDPDDARDFDDAICVERHQDHWQLSVHIADVSHYVRPKSELDHEAYSRGNSVYLPDRVIPMLPEQLSNGLCSLRPDEDRLAFSVFAKISLTGKILSTRFARTIIRSKKRLTYRQAFAILEKKQPTNPLEHAVHTAWDLASVLRKKRFENGSLDLDFPETKVWVDENGRPTKIEKVENDISHQLIEEMMLFANEAVAKEMRIRKCPTIYRVHEPPDEDRLREFRDTALTYTKSCGDLTNRTELQKLLAAVRGKPWEYAVKLGLLKSLKRARYSEEPLGHYGLAKSDYLHFTSPIRRYSDLVAHRALERQLGLTKHGPDSRALPGIAEHISTTERIASDAEREAVKMKKLEFFFEQTKSRKGEVFWARIVEVRNYGMLVELPDVLITGLIHVSALEGDFFVFDPVRNKFRGRKTGVTYSTGEELEVVVSRVDLFKQQVDFAPAPPSASPKTA